MSIFGPWRGFHKAEATSKLPFLRYGWFWSSPSHPILAQNSIFLAQKLLILVRICHGFQSGRMDDSGALQGCFSEVRPKF